MSEYARIKARCLQKGELWEDPDFPAVMASLFYHQVPPFKFAWKRPKEIFTDASFLATDEAYEIVPGKLGDAWLAMTMDVLHAYRGLFARTVPVDQSMDEGYAGVFRFHMWSDGRWSEVLIDDRLPTVNGKLVFLQARGGGGAGGALWPALLEKAYAKVLGSYEAIKYGNFSDGLADLTGGVGQTLNTADLSARELKRLLEYTTIVASVYDRRRTGVPQVDLDSGVYRVCELREVNTPRGPMHLVQLRRPATADAVRTTRIQLDPEEWQHVPQSLDSLMCTWSTFADFCRLFPNVDLLHLDEEASVAEPWFVHSKKWALSSCKGAWKKGLSAGGCKNETNHYFHTNPQVLIDIQEPNILMVCLYQHRIMDPKTIGFSVFRASELGASLAPQDFFKRNKSLFNTDFTNVRRMCYRWKAASGTYLVVPSTFEPNEEAEFTLLVFAARRVRVEVRDEPLRMGRPLLRDARSRTEPRAFAFYEAIFVNAADERKTVNVFELQEVLDACLPNDYVKGCCSLETCRQAVLTMARSGNERLTLTEFRDFMCNLQQWHAAFKAHFREKVGVLKAERLREALAAVGFTVPHHVLSVLVLRFMKKDGMLRFCDFVCVLLYLYRVFDIHCANHSGPLPDDLAERLKLVFRC